MTKVNVETKTVKLGNTEYNIAVANNVIFGVLDKEGNLTTVDDNTMAQLAQQSKHDAILSQNRVINKNKIVALKPEQAQTIKRIEEEVKAKLKEKQEKDKKKSKFVQSLESGQKWLTDKLGIFGSILGHAFIGPIKFFANLFSGNFDEAFSMDTLKMLGSLALVGGGAWGISKLLSNNSTNSSETTTALSSAVTAITATNPAAEQNMSSLLNDTLATQPTGSATQQISKSATPVSESTNSETILNQINNQSGRG